jgi:hypothetical protein
MKVSIPVSVGELVDKLTILDIKLENITDENKLIHIRKEKEELEKLYVDFTEMEANRDVLYQINRGLWIVEDELRRKEKQQEFDSDFVRLARDVYHINDKRFQIKSKINILTQSDIKEMKSYESYS